MLTHKEATWYDLLYDATNTKEGKILVGYDIFPVELRDKVRQNIVINIIIVPY